jgi:hypothetical protein
MYWWFNMSDFGRPVHACLSKIVDAYQVFSEKTCEKNTAMAKCTMLHTKLMWSVWAISISEWMIDPHIDWTVMLTTLSKENSIGSEFPSFKIVSSSYILICMLIVRIAENWKHMYLLFFSLRELWTYPFLNFHILLCQVVFVVYIGPFVRVTTGYHTCAVLPWKLGRGN